MFYLCSIWFLVGSQVRIPAKTVSPDSGPGKRIVLYLQSRVVFPSWTSPVRPRSLPTFLGTLRILALRSRKFVHNSLKMVSGVSVGWTSVDQEFCRPQKSRHSLDFHQLADLARGPPWQNRDKTPPVELLGLPLSEKQTPQVVENLESGGKPKEALETVGLRPRQVRYRPTCKRLQRQTDTNGSFPRQ